jgi:hypothetical protein
VRKLFFLFALAAQTCHGAEDIYLTGAGGASCGQYIEDNQRHQYTQWIAGFLTASQYYGNWKKITSLPDRETISLFSSQYCNRNPTHKMFQVAAALSEEIGGPKAFHQWRKP